MRRYLGQTLQAGAADGAAVLDLQTDLRALGYLNGGLDGDFGQGTARGLRALSDDLLNGAGVRAFNRGRVPAVTDVLSPAFGACLADMLDDDAWGKVPSSTNPRADNAAALAALAQAPSNVAPTPFLLAMVKQESSSQHYREPSSRDADSHVVVGLDRNQAAHPDRITSRGYGLGQFTIANHPPTADQVADFIVDIQGNVSTAYAELREKFDRFVVGPADTADDRKAEHPLLPLRLCKFPVGDPKFMRDCANCARAAPKVDIVSKDVGGTPFFGGSGGSYHPTQYYSRPGYSNVPDRAAFGCDWPYAARRYNGSGVNSYHYQTKILLNLAGLA